MSEIKAKEVAFIRTTGEPVFVLAVHAELNPSAFQDYPELTPKYATVRYAMVAKNSVTHIVTTFWVDELMTRAERDVEKQDAREASFEQLFKSEPQPNTVDQIELPFKASEVN